MNIDKHISELLFEHDCVIIPGFGGFVCNYSPAKIISGKNLFIPPHKQISFNRNLKNNDGLLANQISRVENISYSEANNLICVFIESLNKEITSTRRFELKNIGTFYSGEENTLLFEQDETVNYLQESFGMNSFHSSVIKRETLERKIEKKLEDRKIIPSKEEKHISIQKKRIPIVRYIAIAASLIIVASLAFVFLKTDALKNINFASLNPFAKKAEAFYKPDADAFNEDDVAKDNVRDLIAANRNDTMHYLNIMLDGNIPFVVSLEESKPEVKTIAKPNHKKSSGHFHVIGGAFSVPENAEKFKKKLEKQGYNAIIFEKKLQFVSYGSYATREEALEALDKIRATQSDAWLMVN
jgi:nucleoid DNA-binding protein